MAPRLSDAKHEILRRLITNGVLADGEIAEAIPCTTRSIRKARSNLHRFGTTTAPGSRGGRPRVIDPPTIKALLEHLKDENDDNLVEQTHFLYKRNGIELRRKSNCASSSLVSGTSIISSMEHWLSENMPLNEFSKSIFPGHRRWHVLAARKQSCGGFHSCVAPSNGMFHQFPRESMLTTFGMKSLPQPYSIQLR
jgi:hypothetical protein